MKSLLILKINLLAKTNHILSKIKKALAKPLRNIIYIIIQGKTILSNLLNKLKQDLIIIKEQNKIRKIKLVIGIWSLVLLSVFLIIKISPLFLNKELKIKRYTQRADYFYEKGKYQKAKEIYEKIVKKFHSRKEREWAYYRIGQCCQKLKLFPRAIFSYERFCQQYPHSDYLLEVKYNLACSYQKVGNLEKATQILRKTIYKFPQDKIIAKLYLTLADCLSQQNKTEESISIYQKITHRYPQEPQSAQAYLKLGDIYLKKEHYSEAVLYYSSFLKQYPYSEEQHKALFSLARCYLLQKEMDKALSMFSLLVNKFPQGKFRGEALFIIGDILYRKEEYNKGLSVLRRIIEENKTPSPLLSKTRKKIADIYLAQKKYPQAIQIYEEMLNHPYFPDEDKIYFRLGNLYKQMGDYQRAEITFKKFVKYFPLSQDISLAYFELGDCLYKQNLYLQGIESFQKITKQNISRELKGKTLRQIGEGYATLTLWKKAIDAFQQSLFYLEKEEIPSLMCKIGKCYWKLEDFSSARKTFSSLLNNSLKNSLSYEDYLEMGTLLAGGKREEKKMALGMYGKAIDKSLSQEEVILALYEIGKIEQELDLTTSAIETYQQIIDLSSKIDSPQVSKVREKTLFHLADIHYSLKKYDKAQSLYARVAEEFPQGEDISWCLYQMGNCFRHRGQYEEAKRFYTNLTRKSGHSFWSELAKTIMNISRPISITQ